MTCGNPECESVTTHSYDLNELASTIVWAQESLGEEPFKIVLPYLSEATKREVWVGVRFLRAVDANNILAKRKTKRRMTARPGGVRTNNRYQEQRRTEPQQLDDSLTENLERLIVSVMGVQDPFTIRSFVSKLHAKDTATIREWLRDNTPGIDNTVTVTCPDCSNEFTVELPITESFFRPAKPR